MALAGEELRGRGEEVERGEGVGEVDLGIDLVAGVEDVMPLGCCPSFLLLLSSVLLLSTTISLASSPFEDSMLAILTA